MNSHEDNVSMARACAANSIAPSTKRAVSHFLSKIPALDGHLWLFVTFVLKLVILYYSTLLAG